MRTTLALVVGVVAGAVGLVVVGDVGVTVDGRDVVVAVDRGRDVVLVEAGPPDGPLPAGDVAAGPVSGGLSA